MYLRTWIKGDLQCQQANPPSKTFAVQEIGREAEESSCVHIPECTGKAILNLV